MLYQMENQHGGDVYGGGITLDFSANTNPLGTPPGVLEAVCRALPQLHRYSDPYCRRLVQAIAGHEQVPASYILCGNGAADLIFRLVLAAKPRTALVTAPTFAEYATALETVGCTVERHFLREENDFAVTEDILNAVHPGIEMVFLCQPNNPTGQLAQPALAQMRSRGRTAGGGRVLPRFSARGRYALSKAAAADQQASCHPQSLHKALRHGGRTAGLLPLHG